MNTQLSRSRFGFYLLFAIHVLVCGSMVVWRLTALHTPPDGPVATAAAPSAVFYGRALYWVMTCLSTVGFGDIYPVTIPAQMYAVVVMVFTIYMNVHLLSAGLAPALRRSVVAQEQVAGDVVEGGGVELGWVVARTGGGFPRPVCPSLTSTTGPYPGCLVSQPPRLLTIPEPHQGAGGREIPPCLCVCRARSGHVGGSGHWVRAQLHTFCLHWAAVLLSAFGGECVCPVLRAPAAGQGSPTLRLLGGSVGRVTGSFLQPTTEPQRGARGMWPVALLD